MTVSMDVVGHPIRASQDSLLISILGIVYGNLNDEYWIDRVGICGLKRGDFRPCSA